MIVKNRRKMICAVAVASVLSLSACTKQEEQVVSQAANESESVESSNPFSQQWDTPFGAPPFGEIKTEHFLPAFEDAILAHKAEIENIASEDAAPTFDNTLAQMERSGSSFGLQKASRRVRNFDERKTV